MGKRKCPKCGSDQLKLYGLINGVYTECEDKFECLICGNIFIMNPKFTNDYFNPINATELTGK